jgi:hypothetical protein
MSQVDDLCSLALKNTAHDVDSGIMTVKKRGCCYDTDLIVKLITHIVAKSLANLAKAW